MRIKMKAAITKVNRTLFELETGILIFGIIGQIFVIFLQDKAGYSIGLWLGILIAALAAFHMWFALDKGLSLGERNAAKYIGRHSIIRYSFITVALCLIALSGIANPLSAFLGIMGLKAAAYMQFFTKRISKLIYGEEILPDLIEEPADEQET